MLLGAVGLGAMAEPFGFRAAFGLSALVLVACVLIGYLVYRTFVDRGAPAVEPRAITPRGDLAADETWLAGPRDRPLVVDAKIADDGGSWWLQEAFRGH